MRTDGFKKHVSSKQQKTRLSLKVYKLSLKNTLWRVVTFWTWLLHSVKLNSFPVIDGIFRYSICFFFLLSYVRRCYYTSSERIPGSKHGEEEKRNKQSHMWADTYVKLHSHQTNSTQIKTANVSAWNIDSWSGLGLGSVGGVDGCDLLHIRFDHHSESDLDLPFFQNLAS